MHCETTSGILNPVAEVAAIVKRAGKRLLVDSMPEVYSRNSDALLRRLLARQEQCGDASHEGGNEDRERNPKPRYRLCIQ